MKKTGILLLILTVTLSSFVLRANKLGLDKKGSKPSIRLIPNQGCTQSDWNKHFDGSGNHSSGCDDGQACKRVERAGANRGTYYYQCFDHFPDVINTSHVPIGIDISLTNPHHYELLRSTDAINYTQLLASASVTNSAIIYYDETNSSLFNQILTGDVIYKFKIYNSTNILLETVYYHTAN